MRGDLAFCKCEQIFSPRERKRKNQPLRAFFVQVRFILYKCKQKLAFVKENFALFASKAIFG